MLSLEKFWVWVCLDRKLEIGAEIVVDVDVVQAVVRVVEPSGHLETFLQFSDSCCREISSSPIVKEYWGLERSSVCVCARASALGCVCERVRMY